MREITYQCGKQIIRDMRMRLVQKTDRLKAQAIESVYTVDLTDSINVEIFLINYESIFLGMTMPRKILSQIS